MGKYSLENHEQYPMFKRRPRYLGQRPENKDIGEVEFAALVWCQAEPGKAHLRLEPVLKKLESKVNLILRIVPQPPDWVREKPPKDISACFAHFIRKTASMLDGRITGVEVDFTDDDAWRAATAGYRKSLKLVRLGDESGTAVLNRAGVSFGLIIPYTESSWTESLEAMAGFWKQYGECPVYIQGAGQDPTGEHLADMRRLHARGADFPNTFGYHFQVRRVTYPRKLSSKGALPIRFWFANTGTADCCHEIKLILKLSQEGEAEWINLHTDSKNWGLGDFIHNEIAVLPELAPGRYRLSIGMHDTVYKENIAIDMDAECVDCFYPIGEVDIDTTAREELFSAWEDYYPEGYYPLEDPKAPKAPKDPKEPE